MLFRKSLKLLFLAFLLIIGACPLQAQMPDLKFEHIGSESELPQSTIQGIVKDKYGFMWFGTWSGLCRYDGYTFKTYKFDPLNNKSISNNRILNLIKDSKGNIWVLSSKEGELCRYNYENDDFDRFPADKLSPSFVKLLDRWNHFSTVNYSYGQFTWRIDRNDNSLFQVNRNTGSSKNYRYNLADRWSLSSPYMVDIYKDNHNIFWAGTFNGGINKANLNAKPFDYYYHDPKNTNSIIDNYVRAICEDNNGNIWVGTHERGITIIGKNSYKHLTFKVGKKRTSTHNEIKTIFSDSKGTVWIGTRKGLLSYDPVTETLKDFKEMASEFGASSYLGTDYTPVYGITEDRDHNLWIACSYRGVYKYNLTTKKLIHFDPKTTLGSLNATAIIQNKLGQICVGTEKSGISIWKPLGDTIAVVAQFNNDKKHVLSDNRIIALFEDMAGLTWIGTGNGVDRFDPVSKEIVHLSNVADLSGVLICGITQDSKGDLWISHKKGITRLNTKNNTSRTYTEQDGLQSNELTDAAVFRSRNFKRLYFGGSKGFNAFNPDSVFADRTLPVNVLTDMEILDKNVEVNKVVNGRIILNKPLYLTKELELTYDDKSVSFEFAGLHYANPKANQYAYKLEGFNEEWVYTDAHRRIATYSNLAAGKYVFKVISSNSDGIWNLKPATLKIIVHPPFWASIWAYFVYALLLLMGIGLYHIYYTRYTRLQSQLSYELLVNEKENELHQSKLNFFTNISHEIKTPLTLILAPLERLSELFRNNTEVYFQISTMRNSGEMLLKLINQLLDFRRLETGHVVLNLKDHDIVVFLKNLLDLFNQLAKNQNIQLQFEHQVKSCNMLFDDDKLEKVISNLLSNALKFTPVSGWIKVKFSVIPSSLGDAALIEVVNLGTGISEEDKLKIFKPFQQASGKASGGTGLGLAFSKSLVELHGGTIELESRLQSDGLHETYFRVQLPLNKVNVNSLPTDDVSKPLITDGDFVSSDYTDIDSNLKEDIVLINGKRPSLLLVEDNRNLRGYLKECFNNIYEVFEAENGKEGLTVALQEIPNLIISDVMMDEMDGFEFCKQVKSDVKMGHIPVVLLTARAPDQDKIEGIESGADDYVTKPFNLELLKAKVKNLLLSREKLKERYRIKVLLPVTDTTSDLPLSVDEKLFQNLLQYVEQQISDPELGIEEICTKLSTSKSNLYRKVRAVSGLSVFDVIKEIRLKRAKEILSGQKFNVNEVAYLVGFADGDHFRKCFKSEFGISPSEYKKLHSGSVEPKD